MKNMAIEYVMLFTTKQTKQECIHIHVIKLMMMKRGRQRKKNRWEEFAQRDLTQKKKTGVIVNQGKNQWGKNEREIYCAWHTEHLIDSL
jgi:hypothetical protein